MNLARFVSFKWTQLAVTSNRLLAPTPAALLLGFNRFLKEPAYPPLKEEDIREIFTKGSGPGGQKLNKATNRCQLKHLPTGIIVSCHETRSLEENRRLARKYMQQKLDLHYNGESSYLAQSLKENQEKKVVRKAKAHKLLEKKKAFKESLENETKPS